MEKTNISSLAEQMVCSFINDLLADDEEIKVEYVLPEVKKGLRYIADIYLLQGCRKLKVKPKSVIEIKTVVLFDTVYRYKNLFDNCKKEWNVGDFYIVYLRSRVPEYSFKSYESNDFHIKSFEELKEDKKYEYKEFTGPSEEDKQRILIENAKHAVKEHKCTLFLGAGVSIDAGLPNWDKLLKKMLVYSTKHQTVFSNTDYDCIQCNCANSSLIVARYIKTGLFHSKDEQFIQELHDSLYKEIHPERQLAETIAKCIKSNYGKSIVGIESVITYNYDDLIEQELNKLGVNNFSVYEGNRDFQEKFPVYHVHGVLPQNNSNLPNSKIILCEEDYHDVYKEAYLWSNVEQLHALGRTTCFFIGLSMTDPNLRRLLDFSHEINDGCAHFVFLQKTKFSWNSNENQDVENVRIQEEIMNDLGLNVIWFNDFEELPKLLENIF